MKKQTLKKALMASLVGVAAVTLASCNGGEVPSIPSDLVPTDKPTVKPTEKPTETPDVKKPFVPENYAKGAKSYVAASYSERTEILGLLEKYAFDNNLTGLTIFGDGGYVMYNPGVSKGASSYIPGYGFGVVSEGDIVEDLAGETNAKWKRFYHASLSNDPKTVNQMNDNGSVVSDIIGNTAGTYFTTYMNEYKDGYNWGGGLSKQDRPIAVNADAQGLATKYRVEVKVGSEAKYHTLSTKMAKYNNREIALEDYMVPYAMLRTQKYNMLRGGEGLTGAGSIKGLKEYFDKTKTGPNADLWNEKVGIKQVTEDGKNYIEFEFNVPTNTFYAMYYLSSSMAAPVPADFIRELGGGDFEKGVAVFGNHTNEGLTPVDTYLSTGPYTLSYWEKDKAIVFDKNPNYVENHPEGRYKIKGLHYEVLKSINEDPEANFKEFMSNKIHACGLPRTKLAEFRDDPRTTQTKDNSTFKLNMNTTTQDEWVKLFGKDGKILKTPEDKYWTCEPAMSNKNFIRGLNFSIDRNTYAAALGKTPSSNYFGSGYLSDPENGISYNSTDAHKNAVAELLSGTQNGYNLEYAKESFKKASEELIAAGHYKKGDTITIEIAWQTPSDKETFHNPLKKYFEDAFNNCGGGLKLNVEFYAGPTWKAVYEDKMQVGQFDIGFGAISGNSLNPINFLEVLKSDNSSGFTLNWGVDTNKVNETLYYDGMYWSFDALWLAADQGGFFKDGVSSPIFDAPAKTSAPTVNADGTVTLKLPTSIQKAEGVSFTVKDVVLFGHSDLEAGSDYIEESVEFVVNEDGSITCTFTAEQYAKYKDFIRTGVDVYFDQTVAGINGSGLKTIEFPFAKEA